MEKLRRENIRNMHPYSQECTCWVHKHQACPTSSQEWASPMTRSSNGCWTWLGGARSNIGTSIYGMSYNQYEGKTGLGNKGLSQSSSGSVTRPGTPELFKEC